jgi:hypothetical protein
MTPLRPRLFAVLSALAVAAAGRAEAPPAAVRDDAGLFGADARADAEDQILRIRDRYHLDVVVETVAAAPADQRDRLKHLKTKEIAQFMKTWAVERAEAADVNGVYFFICEEPPDVEVVVRPEDAFAKALPTADQRRLHSTLIKTMKKGPKYAADRDKALRAALGQLSDVLHDNLAARPAFDWNVVGGVIGGALALWFVLGAIRMLLHKPDQEAIAAGLERPSLTAGLLGGMFGASAGMWIYDRLFFGGPHAPPVEDAPPIAPPPEPAPAEPPADQREPAAPAHW